MGNINGETLLIISHNDHNTGYAEEEEHFKALNRTTFVEGK